MPSSSQHGIKPHIALLLGGVARQLLDGGGELRGHLTERVDGKPQQRAHLLGARVLARSNGGGG